MVNSMMLVTASWKNQKTFRMIPLVQDCPFNEIIFDVDQRVLAVISKEKKQSLHMLTKLDEVGDPMMVRSRKRSEGKPYAEERKTLETYYEYYVENPEEIDQIINLFAINNTTFDYKQYLNKAWEPVTA